ncbi:MAG: acyl-CoA synthetase [Micromonosporaceae bacterium]|nr:acyl-CoA synthetase [Micromonosporaceae bacterium]
MTLLPALSGAFPDRADAVRVGSSAISWESLRGAATAVADRIAGAPAVAVEATASLETVVAAVGALIAGVPLVPVPPDSGPVEREHILTDSGAVPLGPVDLTARSDTSHPTPAGTATALILYTSGTTGAPKGVLLSRDAIAADLDALAEAWQWSADDVLVHGLPLFHVHGLVLGVLGALRTGSRLVHTVRPQPSAYAAAAGTLYFGVPTVWSRVCAEPQAARALSGARLLVSGSAALPVPVFESLRSLTGHEPVERYGMTETLITVSARADGPRRPGCVGTPLPGVATRLALPDGELEVRGPTLFSGYLNRPDATAASFTADGWFRTGDLATVDADGTHRIVGRSATDLIKCGGYRVGAGEVEDALLAHPAVAEAAVVGAPHADLGQEIVAYVVASGASAQELIDFVARRLSVHKRPRRVHLVEALPRNAMGKVQKARLIDA